ncbi:PEP-CTERM sorting domain-containing protein [Candidatus Poribacteria bacterium]|nr:MAG: PEP-CTERM sorting domain-containing protein [Candidatus Poribacteria bacterium]
MKIMFVLAGFVLMIAYCVIGTIDIAQAEEVLGTGTAALLGGDLTDPEDDGAPDADEGYNAIFSANEEPGFGGGEFSFNVFDNILGGGNAKWCCGRGGGIPEEGLHVTAEFEEPYALTHFTVSSANDVPARDPTEWEVQGSNDGEEFTAIFSHDGDSFWSERLQVVLFEAGEDYDRQTTGYRFFRHVTFNTASNPAGAYFQIGEIEYFGDNNFTAVDPKAKLTTTWGSIKNVR